MGKFLGAPPVAYSKKLTRMVGADGAILIGYLLLRWVDTGNEVIPSLAKLEKVTGLEMEEELPFTIKKCRKKGLIVGKRLNIEKMKNLLGTQLQKSLTEWKNRRRTLPRFPNDVFYFHPVKGNQKFYYHCKIPLYQKL